MQLLLYTIINATISLIILFGIPYAWWHFFHREKTPFFQWIGFIRPQLICRRRVLIVFVMIYIFYCTFDLTKIIGHDILSFVGYLENDTNEKLLQKMSMRTDITAILSLFISNFISNCVAVEIFFRGFLCKRLGSKYGKIKGIVFHAILYGMIQSIYLLIAGFHPQQDRLLLFVLIIIFPEIIINGLLHGFLNEKIFNGSIIPGMLAYIVCIFIIPILITFGSSIVSRPEAAAVMEHNTSKVAMEEQATQETIVIVQ